jgi:hypothetical protein
MNRLEGYPDIVSTWKTRREIAWTALRLVVVIVPFILASVVSLAQVKLSAVRSHLLKRGNQR